MKRLSFPHPLALLIGFILFAGLLTYLIPSGTYERVYDSVTDREVVVPGSYKTIDFEPLSVYEILIDIPEGLIYRADIIIMILIFGGAFYIVDKTGALRGGVTYLAAKLKGRESTILIIVGMVFTTLGALDNTQEEIIALIPVLIILTNRLGYNTFITVSISFGCAVIGASFSPMNPFQVGIAQKIAEVPLLSGGLYRILFLLIAFAIWITMIIKQGNKEKIKKESGQDLYVNLSFRHIFILSLVVIAFVVMVYGLLSLGWGYNEMSAEFFVLGVLAGIIGKLGINGTAKAYVEGFREMTFAAFIVGLAGSIYLVLEDGKIIDSIVHGMFMPLQHLPNSLSAIAMMLSHFLLHFPVPSVSGQAVITIPLLTPLSDLIGMSRQVMILAYQFGAGMGDMVVPTNGALIAILAAANITYNKWIKFVMWKLAVILGLCAVAIIIAIFIGY